MVRKRAVGVAVVVLTAVLLGASALVIGNPLSSDAGDAGVQGIETFENASTFERYVSSDRSPPTGERVVRRRVTTDREYGGDRLALNGIGGREFTDRATVDPSLPGSARGPDLVASADGHRYVAPAPSGDSETATRRSATRVIDANRPASPAVVGNATPPGRLLRIDDTLVTLRDDELVGFDVSSPGDPTRTWSRNFSGSPVSARATDGRLYLVVNTSVSPNASGPSAASEPSATSGPSAESGPLCPIEPAEGVRLDCVDVFRPDDRIRVDSVYTALSVDPATGSVDDAVGFVGTWRETTATLTADSLYVTYTDSFDRDEARLSALLSTDEVPEDVKERLRAIRSNESHPGPETEAIREATDEWWGSLNSTEHFDVSGELHGRTLGAYRNYTTTGVVRVDLGDRLDVEASGTVPGKPLTLYSLDERDGILRVATRARGEVDVYALDASTLDEVGRIRDATDGQGIREFRFVGDVAVPVGGSEGTPPVVDLSDPSAPVAGGNVTTPQFRATVYALPVADDRVLRIDRTRGDGNYSVEVRLFDVSDPSNPTVTGEVAFDSDRSPLPPTRRSVLVDRNRSVVFLPLGGEDAVIGYGNASLTVEANVDLDDVYRARFVGDSLYLFADEAVAVLDARTWNRTATLSLDPTD